MAAGHAQRIYEQDPTRGPVAIVDGAGSLRWHFLWEGNPAVYCPADPAPPDLRHLTFGAGHLPYYPNTPGPSGRREWPTDWRVRDHRPTIYLTDAERARGHVLRNAYGSFILLEPPGRDRKSPNRLWLAERWQALATELARVQALPVLQLDRPDAMQLTGVVRIPHDGFRAACAVLSAASLVVLTEGGLSIAAGALRIPAVVLLSPCGPPAESIGFPEHLHLVDDDPATPCGRMKPCDHCRAAWQRLTVERVMSSVLGMLQEPCYGAA